MARAAIGVRSTALLVRRSCVKIRGMVSNMLVRVVTEVVCLRPCFMPAVASRRSPRELQRHQHQQEKDQIATHKRANYRGNPVGRTRQGQSNLILRATDGQPFRGCFTRSGPTASEPTDGREKQRRLPLRLPALQVYSLVASPLMRRSKYSRNRGRTVKNLVQFRVKARNQFALECQPESGIADSTSQDKGRSRTRCRWPLVVVSESRSKAFCLAYIHGLVLPR